MEALSNGLVLTVAGMGVVFGFLVLLIVVMLLSSTIVNKLFPEMETTQAPKKTDAGADIAVAIAAAKAKMQGGNQ